MAFNLLMKMKRMILLVLAVLALTGSALAAGKNFPPDNKNVKLTSTNLPIVWINVNGQTIDRYERITARMKIIYNGAGRLNYADTVAIPGQNIDYEGYVALRYRGSSSFSSSDKKPYSFRPLDKPLEEGGEKKKVNILGMGKDNNWAIIAPYADKSMMRDLLAYELARPWMEYSPQGRYCELFLDNIYYGVYIMMEVVSKGKHRLNLSDPGESGDEITGGYIMEVNRVENEVTYTSNYHPVSKTGVPYNYRYINFQYKSPDYEDLTADQISYINGQIDKMEKSLWTYMPPKQGRYSEYLDVTNFIDYQIIQELSHNVDGYRLSGKFFKRRDSEDPRFKMVVWDMNLTFGNANYYDGWCTDNWIYENNDIINSADDPHLVPFWWYKLNTDPNYVFALKARWAQCRRANMREDHIMALVDSLAHVLTVNNAESRNYRAWPRWGRYVWPNYYVAANFADEVAWLKQWIRDRLAWMDEQLGFDPNAHERGDVNGDDVVDINDVTALIDYLMNGNADGIDVDAADCNQDGDAAISDVTALTDYLLSGNW